MTDGGSDSSSSASSDASSDDEDDEDVPQPKLKSLAGDSKSLL